MKSVPVMSGSMTTNPCELRRKLDPAESSFGH
jgi:hypothetical protein